MSGIGDNIKFGIKNGWKMTSITMQAMPYTQPLGQGMWALGKWANSYLNW